MTHPLTPRARPRPVEALFGGPTYHLRRNADGIRFDLKVTPPPSISPEPIILTLTESQAARFLVWYNSNELIQTALPDLSPAQREAILTGLPQSGL